MSLHETSPILFLCVDLAGSAPLREDDTCMLRRQYGSREGAMCAEETQRDLLFYRLSPLWKGAAPTKRCSDRRHCSRGAEGGGMQKSCAGRKPRAARIAVRNVYFYCLIVLRFRCHATGIRKEPCRTCRRVRGCKHRPLSDCLHAHPEGCNKQSLQMKDPHCR